MGTVTFDSVAVEIPDDFEWPNEFGYRNVEQKKSWSISGALIVESKARQAGRPIELRGGATFGWMAREDVIALRVMADLDEGEGELVFRGQTFAVMFDHEAGAIETTPIFDIEDSDADDKLSVTLRFIVSSA